MKNKITGIILAAGGSKRLGQPKQILKINNEYLINLVISNSLESNLSSIVVVLGAYYNQIRPILNNENKIQIVNNRDWRKGQSTSLISGLKIADTDKTNAVMFLLGDQPFITKNIINSLIDKFDEGMHDVVMVKTGEKKTPPIIFSRSCFEQIYKLEGDKGARDIIGSLKTGYLENLDPTAIIDIDTKEEYKIIKNAYSHI